MRPTVIVERFDQFLTSKKLRFEAVVIGAGALSLLKIISRETKDVDVIDPILPSEIKAAAKEFAKLNPGLLHDWINNGPSQMRDKLRTGWQKRLRKIYSGKSIVLFTLDRIDLLATKLQGLGDRGEFGPDWNDIKAMKPTQIEMDEALSWATQQDANPSWPAHVTGLIKKLMKEMKDGF